MRKSAVIGLLTLLFVFMSFNSVKASTTKENYDTLKSYIFSNGKAVDNGVKWEIKKEGTTGVSENGKDFEASIWYSTNTNSYYFYFGEFRDGAFSSGPNLYIDPDDLSIRIVTNLGFSGDTYYMGETTLSLKDIVIGNIPFIMEYGTALTEETARAKANNDFAVAYRYFDSYLKTHCNLSMEDLGFGKKQDSSQDNNGQDSKIEAPQGKANTTAPIISQPVIKKRQDMIVKAVKKTIKASKLKKKAQTVKVITVKSAQGNVTYKIAGGNKKSKKVLKINSKNGKITIKKKTKKGTYKVRVSVTAAGNKQYYAASKVINVSVKVK